VARIETSFAVFRGPWRVKGSFFLWLRFVCSLSGDCSSSFPFRSPSGEGDDEGEGVGSPPSSGEGEGVAVGSGSGEGSEVGDGLGVGLEVGSGVGSGSAAAFGSPKEAVRRAVRRIARE
jgi:hypothetical protein